MVYHCNLYYDYELSITAILTGITQSLKIVVVLFIVMSIYIIFVNFVWAILYNRGKKQLKNVRIGMS
ncbi:hypothetical protein ICE98_00265 [Lactococcus lactis]|nr:hypothetical protein [Lactococcus lactis]